MEGAKKGSFWSSTAAVITAVGTLLAGLVAVATFLLSQQFFDGSASTDDPGGPPPTDSQGKQLDGELLSGPIKILLAHTDFDVAKVPVRDPGTFGNTDLFYWRFENAISAPYRMAKWTGGGQPTQSQCATLVATHGIGDNLSFEEDNYFCLKTNQARITMFQVLKETSNGWEIEATTWKQRLNVE